MRIEQLRLDRYGMHEGLVLDFPASDCGLHLLVGPNEVGKSTARRAIGDLVFGFPKNTLQAYRHKMSTLQVGAKVQLAGQTVDLVRLKKNKDNLQDLAGTPVRLDPFAVAISGLQREDFERDYCLGLEELTEGSRMIVADRADSARMLFAAASGISAIKPLMESISGEAEKLFAFRAAGHRTYYQAEAQYETASKAAKEATLRRAAWNRLERDAESAEQATEAASRKVLEATNHQTRLTRIKAAAPKVRQLEQQQTALSELIDVPEMPLGALSILDSALDIIRDAEPQIDQDRQALQTLEEQAAAVQVNEQLVGMEAASLKLSKSANAIQKHAVDIVLQRDRASEQLAVGQDAARAMGWAASTAEELKTRIPAEIALRELRVSGTELDKSNEDLKRLARQAQEALEQLQGRKRDLERCIEVTPVSQKWLIASEAASALGDVPSRLNEMREEIDTRRQRVVDSLSNLSPWAGGIEGIAALEPIKAEAAQAAQVEIQGIDARVLADRQHLESVRSSLVLIRNELSEAQAGQQIPSSALITAARADRNQVWDLVKKAPGDADTTDRFETKMTEADSISDLRFDRSQEAHRLDELHRRRDEIEQQLFAAQTAVENSEARRNKRVAVWHQQLAEADLPAIAPDRYPAWLIAYHQTKSRHGSLQDSLHQRAALEIEASKAKKALEATMREAGAWVDEFDSATLSTLVGQCSTRKLYQKEAETNRKAALNQVDQAKSKCDMAERELAEARAENEQSKESWKRALQALGLPEHTGVEASQTVYDSVPKLREALGLHAEAQSRVDGMQRDLNAFDRLARETAVAAGLATEGLDAHQLQNAVATAVTDAVAARDALSRINDKLVAKRQSLAQTELRRNQASARIAPLAHSAGSEDESAIRTAISRYEQRQRLESDLRETKAHLATIAAGIPETQLIQEVAEANLDELEGELAMTARTVEEASTARDHALSAAGGAKQTLTDSCSRRGSASAVGDREAAVAAMAGAIADYIPLTIMNALLDWSMKRYRENHKDPLLAKASEIFGLLTEGEYRQVTVDDEAATDQLILVTSSGVELESRALSSGARDQLFLALRIAAIEVHLDSGAPPLPFVADDLFVNFDDRRAAAGFAVLARLAKRTQVIYISHHSHLVDVALSAVGPGVGVIRMNKAVTAVEDKQ